MKNDQQDLKNLVHVILALILIGLSVTGFIIIVFQNITNSNLDIKILIFGLSLSIIPYVIFRGIEVILKKQD